MAFTFADVIKAPELFDRYTMQKEVELDKFVQSGITVNDARLNELASSTTTKISLPSTKFTLDDEAEDVVEGNKLTPSKISTMKEDALLMQKAKAWASTDMSAEFLGADPMMLIGDKVAAYWVAQNQRLLLSQLSGIFGTYTDESSKQQTPLASNIHDISGKSGAASNFSGTTLIDAKYLLGDASGQIMNMVVDSATEAAIIKETMGVSGVVPRDTTGKPVYAGLGVITDDMVSDKTEVAKGIHTAYLFANGSVAYGSGAPTGFVQTEIDRDKLLGSGVNYLISRRCEILHPYGLSFTGTPAGTFVTKDELKDTKNYTVINDAKNIGIICFKYKLA